MAGIWIETATGKNRKALLVLSLIANCGMLFIFKYFNFFATNFTELARALGWNYSLNALQIVLPIGLLVMQLINRKQYIWHIIDQKPTFYRWAAIYFFVVFFIVLALFNDQSSPQKFIYIQYLVC